MAISIIMHVNYCEQGQTIDEICHKAADWGFDGVEFRRTRAGISEQPEAYLDQIADAVSHSGLKTVIFGSPGPNLATADAKVREAEIAEYVKFYRLAADRFKLTVCNTMAGSIMNPAPGDNYFDCEKHGSFIATEDHWKYAADGFKLLGEVAAELGFRFAFETHMCYLHDLPAAAKKLADRIDHPAVGVNLDYGNALYLKNPPDLKETIRTVGEKLYYVHLKNSVGAADGSRITLGLSEGEINHRAYLKMLKEAGYHGPICIEAPRNGDREWFAQADIAYLKSLMRDLEWL